MKNIIQTVCGGLEDVNKIKDALLPIQLVQLKDGSLKHITELDDGDEIVSFNEEIKFDKIEYIKIKDCNKFVYLALKNGFRILLPSNFKLLTTNETKIFSKQICDLKEGEFIALPSYYKTKSVNIKFDPWEFDDHLYVGGIKGWYLKELNKIIISKNLLLKEIADKLKVPYWLIRRNALCKDSINFGYLKKFIKTYLYKNKIYEMLDCAKGLKNEKSATKLAKFPYAYDENLSYLDAAMVGDGHIVKSEKQAIIESTNKEYGEILQKLFYKVHKYYKGSNRINLPGSLAYFYSKILDMPKGNKSKIVGFPKYALVSNNRILVSALRGLIDTEGNVCIDDKYDHLSITSSSFKLILGIISAVLRLNLLPSIWKSNKDSTWEVKFSGIKVKNLFQKIKYLKYPTKNKSLRCIRCKQFINTQVIPKIGNVIRNSRKKLRLSSYRLGLKAGLVNTNPVENSGNFFIETAIKINNILKNKELENLLTKDLNWSKIVYKKEIKMNSKFIFPKTKDYFFLNHIPVRCSI